AAAAVHKIPPGMVCDRLEPAAEAPRRVVAEVAELLDEFGQDFLGHVLGVGVLEFPLPAPPVHVPPVTLEERAPGGLARRVLPQPCQEGHARRGERGIRHGYYSGWGRTLAPVLGRTAGKVSGKREWRISRAPSKAVADSHACIEVGGCRFRWRVDSPSHPVASGSFFLTGQVPDEALRAGNRVRLLKPVPPARRSP